MQITQKSRRVDFLWLHDSTRLSSYSLVYTSRKRQSHSCQRSRGTIVILVSGAPADQTREVFGRFLKPSHNAKQIFNGDVKKRARTDWRRPKRRRSTNEAIGRRAKLPRFIVLISANVYNDGFQVTRAGERKAAHEGSGRRAVLSRSPSTCKLHSPYRRNLASQREGTSCSKSLQFADPTDDLLLRMIREIASTIQAVFEHNISLETRSFRCFAYLGRSWKRSQVANENPFGTDLMQPQLQ